MRNSKFIVSAAVAVSAIAGISTASAADMAVKAPVAPPLIDPWVGFYVGVNLGGSWGDWRASSSQRVYNFESFTANPKVNGVVGGVQAGYNWRLAPQWLWGIEGDIQATGERGSQNWIDPGLANTLPPTPPPDDFVPRPGGPATLHHEWKFPWFGTVRLRAGYNPTTNLLLYVTGGLAYGESQYSFNFVQPGAVNNFPPSPTTYALSNYQIGVGYAAGAGAEIKLDRYWSVKGEYLFVDLGTRTILTRDIDGVPFRVSYTVRDHIARIGLNYAVGP